MKKLLFILSMAICITLNAQYTKIFDFDGATTGSSPQASLISDGTFLYGMTTYGGTNDLGVIFKVMPNGSGYVKLLDFEGATNGSSPGGSLIFDGTYLYGMTPYGGTNNQGTIFKILPNGNGYVKLLDFNAATSGRWPTTSLISVGAYLYGMTSNGGTNSKGTLFRISPSGSGFLKLLDFTFANAWPYGSLISDGIYLYGMTSSGGTNNKGSIFKVLPNGSSFATLFSFDGATTGTSPIGSLTSAGSFLYGMTPSGGANGMGTLFKIMSNGSGYVKLLDFDGTTNGSNPQGSLIYDGTFLYGTTQNGGSINNNYGTLFKFIPIGNSYIQLYEFNGAMNGSLFSDGTFLYGVTGGGGINYMGTVYKFQLNTSSGVINTFPWTEGFENSGAIPNFWTQEQVNNSGLNWTFGAGNGLSNPANANTGSYNARLKDNSAANNKTKLITPPLNLSSINYPRLKFWHTQQYLNPNQDTLIIFYKTSSTGNWTQLIKYSNSITSWTADSVILPSPTSDYYVAFEGNAKSGYGVCIDDVSIYATVCNLPENAGTITGLNNVCQGQNNVIYTVAAIPNATTYFWSLPNGATGSSTSNTITVSYSNTAVSGNISVYGANNCGNGQASILSTTVNPLPGNAGNISGLISVCQGQNTVNYDISSIPNATSYEWILASGFTGNSTNNNISINFNNTANSGSIMVKGNNSCGASNVSTINVTVNELPALAGLISGVTNVCQAQNQVYFSVSAINNATSYLWTFPSGASGIANLNEIYLDFSSSAVSDNISVKGVNACGEGSVSTFPIVVNPLPLAAGAISGLTSVCQDQQNEVYAINQILYATSYLWTLPSGAYGNSTSNSISLNFNNSLNPDVITVKGINNCGEGDLSTLAYTINPKPDAAGTINGLTDVCNGQNNVLYSVSAIANATSYIWNLPSGANGIANLNEIYLDFSLSAVSDNISVKGVNACGEGSVSTFPIVVNPLPLAAGAISGLTSVCQDQQNEVYTINHIPYATSYLWTLPSGAYGNSTSNSISLNFSSSVNPDIITVRGINNCGEGDISTLAYTINPKPDAAGTINGLTDVCNGQNSVLYSVPAIANATSYIWNLSSGAIGNSTINSISIDFTNIATSAIIAVYGTNNCGDNAASSLTVNINSIPDMAGNIMGIDTLNQGQNNLIYEIPAVNNATTYTWTLPPNVTGNSNSNSISLSFPDSCISGNLIVKGQNYCGEGEPATKYLNIYKQLEVKLFLEGLYSSANLTMNKSQDDIGDHFTGIIADTLSLSLIESNPPYDHKFTFYNQPIETSGYIKVKSPSEFNDSMFISIKHRNHIETWSSSPVSFASDIITYDFSTSANKAYGDNQIQVAAGVFAFYAGDVNQDGLVDGSDMSDTETDNNNFVTGYVVTDVNGDGLIDGSDMSIVESANNNFVSAITP